MTYHCHFTSREAALDSRLDSTPIGIEKSIIPVEKGLDRQDRDTQLLGSLDFPRDSGGLLPTIDYYQNPTGLDEAHGRVEPELVILELGEGVPVDVGSDRHPTSLEDNLDDPPSLRDVVLNLLWST